ncbi:diguanylate cyclase [Candidatus Venteria ishoeyi]|uniref:diguanylate cyclase domain-containing protein n=1 Tax=Candidatus Venteria ishoeyi TaxID=1899563 RepID=UPI0025A67523|nr:diguanylate cyclase [Candidatus Venteria ishoeyi]MDM8547671.1 diguanylate cyclase [Candidatus Venteria ishoeyi]
MEKKTSQVAEVIKFSLLRAANISHEHSDTAPMLIISIGVATHSQDNPKTNMNELLMAADQALYQAKAKAKGLNQIQAKLPQKELIT